MESLMALCPTDTSLRQQHPAAQTIEPILAHEIPAWKRILDIVGACGGLLLFSPAMIMIAIAIKLTSKGPVVFKQKRVGLGGRPFDFYKFRSMVVDAEQHLEKLRKLSEYKDGPAFKMKDDPRITAIGSFIRKYSLDELPQFYNVLKGDMSLVGPRPLILPESDKIANWHWVRAYVRPGITCTWQVFGREERDYDKRIRMDLAYVRSYSLWLDIKLLLMTVPAILSGKGVY